MKLCIQCHETKSDTQFSERYALCKQCYAGNKRAQRAKERAAQAYNADCIKIKQSSDFDFSYTHDLSHEYDQPLVFVQRGFEACRRAGVSPEYFIARYLKSDRSGARNPLVEQAYRSILRESPHCSVTPDLD
jgi:hypothetical protein